MSTVAAWLLVALVLAPIIYLWLWRNTWAVSCWVLALVAYWVALLWPISLPAGVVWFAWERLRG
jgi:hypothetical protein